MVVWAEATCWVMGMESQARQEAVRGKNQTGMVSPQILHKTASHREAEDAVTPGAKHAPPSPGE